MSYGSQVSEGGPSSAGEKGRSLPSGPAFFRRLRFALRRDTLGFLGRVAEEHGDVSHFRVGHWSYWMFLHPDAVRDVLVTHDDDFIKGPALRRARDTLGDGLLTSEGDLHRRQRRLIQPVLHPQHVATYADVMVKYAAQMIEAWRDGQEIDLHRQMMGLTLRVVAKTLFDADVARDLEAIGRAMDISVAMFVRAMTPWGPLLGYLPLPSNFRFKRAWGSLIKTVDRFVQERRAAAGGASDDLLSRLLGAVDAQGDGSGMTDRQLRDESITLFTAGHETTANALTFTLYLLSQHSAVLERLREELGSVLGGRLPTAADVEKLGYTRMVLSESMRLYPPAWGLAREAVRPVTIGGHTIPAGQIILLSQWVTHRDPRWWPDPLTFDPLRFASDSRSSRPRWAYFPFGGGSRQCIGESFAWMEAVLVLATVLQRFGFKYLGNAPPRLRALITLRPDGTVPMRVHAREEGETTETRRSRRGNRRNESFGIGE